jgi:hypothetical protein
MQILQSNTGFIWVYDESNRGPIMSILSKPRSALIVRSSEKSITERTNMFMKEDKYRTGKSTSSFIARNEVIACRRDL